MVADDIVLFAAHGASLDLEDEVILREALEKFGRDIEILTQWQVATVEHMAGEKVWPSGGATAFRFLDERKYEFLEFVLEAVVRVERDVDRVTLGGPVHVLGDGDCTECHIF